ncbi:hypothetical protein BDZ94DRAFT_1261227 [Collybia nuda]|uniref:Uncharacterized protein n=1 Tax=Collybia nuda TaxID=64659 RepID=A0A9P5Y478_9AGAR|nr:hypothetical protein BDZ94DRAFT_1261227 [Collybia nuda]
MMFAHQETLKPTAKLNIFSFILIALFIRGSRPLAHPPTSPLLDSHLLATPFQGRTCFSLRPPMNSLMKNSNIAWLHPIAAPLRKLRCPRAWPYR